MKGRGVSGLGGGEQGCLLTGFPMKPGRPGGPTGPRSPCRIKDGHQGQIEARAGPFLLPSLPPPCCPWKADVPPGEGS